MRFFAGNLTEILPETERKNECLISGGVPREKQAAKERTAERHIKSVARRLQARQYRDSRQGESPPGRLKMACIGAKEKRPFGA